LPTRCTGTSASGISLVGSFHRRDLWEAIEAGDYPEFELGLQLIPEENEFDFVEDHFADPLHRHQRLGDQLGGIEQVEVKIKFILLG
jgi:hypothetical protein